MNILRKDSKGFYVARLIQGNTRKVTHPQQIPCNKSFFGPTPCTIISTLDETRWKLNGLLEIEEDSNILEHWVDVGAIKLICSKLQFKVGKVLEKGNDYKIFEIKEFFPFPY